MKPTLFIICGQVGAGKTTVARKLSKMTNAQIASVDETLKRLLPNPSFVSKDAPPTMEELELCYNAFELLANYTLRAGGSIVIDGAFALQKQREQISGVAKRLQYPYYILYITCPDDVIEERAKRRYELGQGVGYQAHLKIKKIYEPLTEIHYTIDTSKNVEEQLKMFLQKIPT